MTSSPFIAAIDQGTTSTRCLIFNHEGRVIASAQKEHKQIFPRPGWVEHDPQEIWVNTQAVVAGALAQADLNRSDIAAVGITNQRESVVVWDRFTGEPICNVIVWQDTRNGKLCRELAGDCDVNRYLDKTGLPISTYFSGPKVRWILDNVQGARYRAEKGELCWGTMDSWLVWNLTAGEDRQGLHITDVTNASRTLLMDVRTLAWDEQICADMNIPVSMLPHIHSSSQVYGHVRSREILEGVPISGILGDQQAATFGQACLSPGEAKNTYGTGNFLLVNTGNAVVPNKHGLLTTVCYQLGEQAPVYALEGSVAVTGSLVQWLRDNLGIISSAKEIENLAASVSDNGGVYFVPAFSGLFAPRWRSDARGVIVGLTRFSHKGHLARAALEATAFQTREVIDAVEDVGIKVSTLKVDGGMVVNELLMQFQSDILGVPVIRPMVNETTALGAAYAAGLAVGYWEGEEDIRNNWAQDKVWLPSMDASERNRLYGEWNNAVEHSYDLA